MRGDHGLGLVASGRCCQRSLHRSWEKTGWKEAFGKAGEEFECEKTAKITYTATSSGKGLAEYGSETGKLNLKEAGNGKEEEDSFIGTDVGPEGPSTTAGTQIANMDEAGENTTTKEKNSVVAIPIAKSAISVIASLPVGCTLEKETEQPRVLTNDALADEWDQDALKATEVFSNLKKEAACEKTLELNARESASGTTAGFKRYLNLILTSIYGSFTNTAVKSESASEWPELSNKKETGNKTGGELAEKVMKTPGSTGYADLADAIKTGFKTTPVSLETAGKEKYWTIIAKVPNGGEPETAGGPVSPEASSGGGSNCELAKFETPSEIGPNVDWSKAVETNATAGEAGVYPICTLTFDVVWGHPLFLASHLTVAQLLTLYSYFELVLKHLSALATSVHTNHFDVFETGTALETEFLTIFPKP
ncbi:MAG TPA: hypothetical protein VGP17_12720 [Solirubrobacteraceae bacterium]|jgi:hypothetical protein|nr:hypothetical protein [Solirubrobacteraceae bacterium]